MVIAPLLVMKLNWACTAAGSVSNSNSGNIPAAQAVLSRPAGRFGLVVFARKVFVFMFLPDLIVIFTVIPQEFHKNPRKLGLFDVSLCCGMAWAVFLSHAIQNCQ
jgi:hypothetical protein